MENKIGKVRIQDKEYEISRNVLKIMKDNYDLFQNLEHPLNDDERKEIKNLTTNYLSECKELKNSGLDEDVIKDVTKTYTDLYNSNVSAIKTKAYMRAIDEDKLRNLVKSVVVGGDDIDWDKEGAYGVMMEIYDQVKKNMTR